MVIGIGLIFIIIKGNWILLLGGHINKLGCFKQQRSDGRLPVRFVCKMLQATISHKLGEAPDHLGVWALHINKGCKVDLPWSSTYAQKWAQILIASAEETLISNQIWNITLMFAAAVVAVRSASHDAKWATIIIRKMAYAVLLPFSIGHRFGRG